MPEGTTVVLRRSTAVLLGACALVLASCDATLPTASPSGAASVGPRTSGASAAPSVTPSVTGPTPLPTDGPTPAPTGNPDAVPVYTAGSTVETHIAGLRVHARPGTDERVVTGLLPEGAGLLIAQGPLFWDDYGWYLVDDVDAGDPEFTQGWIAAGFNPDPWLVPTVLDVADNPFIAGFANDTDGEYGPVRITDANLQIDWVIAPPTPDGCSFAVDLRSGSGNPVQAIRSTTGSVVAPGVLYPQFFSDHPELTGDLFMTVTSTCRWALTFERVPA